jgi:hypothetical protein
VAEPWFRLDGAHLTGEGKPQLNPPHRPPARVPPATATEAGASPIPKPHFGRSRKPAAAPTQPMPVETIAAAAQPNAAASTEAAAKGPQAPPPSKPPASKPPAGAPSRPAPRREPRAEPETVAPPGLLDRVLVRVQRGSR